MTTSCELDFSAEEIKRHEYYAISIPYEINHDFFLAAYLAAQEGKILGVEEVICFSDYGKGSKFEGEEIDLLLLRLDNLEKNIDNIIKVIPVPTMIGMSDGRVIVGYETHRKYDPSLNKWVDSESYSNYVETGQNGYVNCEKKDILYIVSLIIKLALKAKKLGKAIRFIGE